MRYRSTVLGLIAAIATGWTALAADPMAGKETAVAVCAACHGANGISVADTIPNLAGQKEKYLAAQLKAFRTRARKNDMMNAIAGQLAGDQVAGLAAFFAGLPGGPSGAETSKPLDALVSKRMAFPPDYPRGFTHYTTINFADRKQVRKYYANAAALKAARDGKPMPNGAYFLVEAYAAKLGADKKPVVGADGFFAADKLAFFTAMEMQEGWGKDFPELLRNGDWTYAIFKADKSLRAGLNQATCLACHKPLASDSYLFSLKQLKEVAAK